MNPTGSREHPKAKRPKSTGNNEAPEHASGAQHSDYAHYINSKCHISQLRGSFLSASITSHNQVDGKREDNADGDRAIVNDSIQSSPATISQLQSDALQNMLLAWYHSGYATGRYEALREAESMIDPSKTRKSANQSK